MTQPFRAIVGVGLLLLACEMPALAQTSGDKATAEALFSEGRRLMAAGNYREACPKFEASLRLDPGVGAMLNLGECFERNGQTASAWAEFREAGAAARAAGAKDREDLARQRASALEPKLSRLTIVANAQAEVTRDGKAVDPGAFGTAVPVDPGKHVIEATSPGKQKWSKTVEVGANGARVSVEIPALAEDASAGGGRPPVSVSSSRTETIGSGAGSTQRTIALSVGALGLAGVAAGTYFGIQAMSIWNNAQDHCVVFPTHCDAKGLELKDDANANATVSTVAFVVGGAALVGGAVLWFTAPKSDSAEPKVSVGVGPGRVLVAGRF